MSALGELLRSGLARHPVGPPLLSPDALEALPQQAARHGLSGYVLHLCDQLGVELSPSVRTTLTRDTRSVAAQTLKAKLLLLRALDALQARGVVPVLLKGYGLGQRVYPDPLYRPCSDVDLLVAPATLPEAERALDALGLTRGKEAREDWQREHHHHLNFYGPQGMVELHFRASSSFGTEMSADPMVARAQTATLEGREVRYLRAEDEVPYLATHAAGHALQRLSWLVDLHRLIACTPSLDWDEVVAVARRAETTVPTFLGLWAARTIVGADVPEPVLARLSPGSWRTAIARAVFREDALVAGEIASRHRYFSYALQALFSTEPRHTWAFLRTAAMHAGRRKLGAAFPRITPEGWRT